MPSTQAQEPCYSQFAAPSLLPARDRKRPNSSSEQNESPKKRRASVDVVDDIVISDDEDGEPSAIKSELDLAEMNPRSIKLDPMTIPLSPTIDSTDYSTQHHVISPSFIRAIDRAIDQDTNTEFDLSWVTNEFIAGSKKAHVIVNAEGAEAFTDVTKKILDSLLYDLGKAAAVKYLPESGSNTPVTKLQTKRYIDSLFDVWCANFAHMPSLEKLELNFTSEKKMSFKIYMRARISNAFSSVRRIKSKQSQRWFLLNNKSCLSGFPFTPGLQWKILADKKRYFLLPFCRKQQNNRSYLPACEPTSKPVFTLTVARFEAQSQNKHDYHDRSFLLIWPGVLHIVFRIFFILILFRVTTADYFERLIAGRNYPEFGRYLSLLACLQSFCFRSYDLFVELFFWGYCRHPPINVAVDIFPSGDFYCGIVKIRSDNENVASRNRKLPTIVFFSYCCSTARSDVIIAGDDRRTA